MGSLSGSLFEFLFKYRPVVFERGAFALGAPRPASTIVLVAAVVALPALVTYARARGKTTARDRVVLVALRVTALAVLAVCLLRPMMVLSAAVPQRNVLGILIDDSRSMRIADQDGGTRGAWVRRSFGATGALQAALAQRFLLRFFRFAGSVDDMGSVDSLRFDGSRTQLAPALLRAREALAGVPLAGLVVVTDGAENAPPTAVDARADSRAEAATHPDGGGPGPLLDDAIASLRASGVPVYAVGVGDPTWQKDIQLVRVEAPRQALKGASLAVTVTVTQHGYAGATVPLVVEDSGRIITTQSITFRRDGEAVTVRVHVPAREAGARRLRFRIPPEPGEMVTENNERYALVAVADRREKVLYIEGEPRFELKFLRRAVADDSSLQVVSLLRTAEGKFLRLGVDDSLELVAGFPKTRAELFRYRAVILGSVEASFFTGDELRMLADFVGDRGGGLLTLGGRRALAEGGYAGTPLADVLPLVLDAPQAEGPRPAPGSAPSYFTWLKPVPTPIGAGHPAMQVAATEEASLARWRTLPPVSSVNRVGALKPGATALLMGEADNGARQPVLAWQRFGRGKAIALPVQDTWMWQMHADIPVGDRTHETFWRQTLRWLVSDVPDRVVASTSADRIGVGEAVVVHAEVSDATYQRVNGAQVTARITGPAGARADVPLTWSVEHDGEYRAMWTPPTAGVYTVEIAARGPGRGADTLRSRPIFIDAGPSSDEWFEAEMRRPLLERIASETGGRFYAAAAAAALPGDVVYTRSGTTLVEQKDLWDMPAVFIVLVALVAGEWAYRRIRGLA